jgi:aspartyl-tRNA(Asn)/glutamyl-tRNA(Gln) amidotransferase subunit A
MSSSWPVTISRLSAAWQSGATTPAAVLKRLLLLAADAAAADPPHRALIAVDEAAARGQADDSSRRFEQAEVRGPLEGIPIGIKDEVDVAGMPTRAGTAYLPADPVRDDASCVQRLRGAGAVVVGKTHQHELGLGATGVGPQARVPRNPHNPSRAPGGSSSGSAVAVALGLMPLCVGTDAGGSVRIPASLCGVFGLKPTYGRVSRRGDLNLNGSLGHVGAIANSVDALAAALRAMAGPDPADPVTSYAPASFEQAPALASPKGLRIGIDASQWQDASADVAARCDEALDALERAGATRCSVSIERVRHSRAVGYTIMGAEAAEFHRGWPQLYRTMGLDVRMILGLGARIRARDYVRALRVRDLLRASMASLFADLDVIALPTTLATAPLVRPEAEKSGELDDATTSALTGNTFLANVTGVPAISCPVGLDRDSLPVGLQLLGRAWDEASVLGVAGWLEREQVALVRRGKVSFDLLE